MAHRDWHGMERSVAQIGHSAAAILHELSVPNAGKSQMMIMQDKNCQQDPGELSKPLLENFLSDSFMPSSATASAPLDVSAVLGDSTEGKIGDQRNTKLRKHENCTMEWHEAMAMELHERLSGSPYPDPVMHCI